MTSKSERNARKRLRKGLTTLADSPFTQAHDAALRAVATLPIEDLLAVYPVEKQWELLSGAHTPEQKRQREEEKRMLLGD